MQVLRNEDVEKSLKKVDPQLLKMALTPYPKLKAALFPPCTPHGILPPDISLYHLVQVHTWFLVVIFGRTEVSQEQTVFSRSGGMGTVVSSESVIWS